MYPADVEQLARDRQASLLAEAERRRLLRLAGAARVARGDPADWWGAGLAAAVVRLALMPAGRVLVLFRRPPWAAPERRRSEAPGQQPA